MECCERGGRGGGRKPSGGRETTHQVGGFESGDVLTSEESSVEEMPGAEEEFAAEEYEGSEGAMVAQEGRLARG